MWHPRRVRPISTPVGEVEGGGRLKEANHVLAPRAIYNIVTELNTTSRMLCLPIWSRKGAFVEHAALLASLGADVREVRLPQEFEGLDGIVLPGKHVSMTIPTEPICSFSTCESNCKGPFLMMPLGSGCPWCSDACPENFVGSGGVLPSSLYYCSSTRPNVDCPTLTN